MVFPDITLCSLNAKFQLWYKIQSLFFRDKLNVYMFVHVTHVLAISASEEKPAAACKYYSYNFYLCAFLKFCI